MDMIKITGLWKKEGKNGVFYAGSLGYGAQVLVFQNKYKKGENDPDLQMFIAEKQEKKASGKPFPESSADDGGDVPF